MSNQKKPNQDETKKNADVEKRRRFIKGAGIAAPVVLTLSSPSVFGALCLSQMMSGNESRIGTGSCTLGLSPVFWKNPVGSTPQGDTSLEAWSKAGFNYGTCQSGKNKTKWDSYTGGTKFSDSIAFGAGGTRAMREILGKYNGTLDWHLIVALLNANYFKGTYILSPAEVKGLCNHSIFPPPPFGDVITFLESTWT
jgi:hypothetical protein